MAVFEWRGLNPAGREVKGVRDADNPKVLRALLKREGILLTQALEESAAKKANARNIDFGRYFRRVTTLDLAMMTRQFATLLKSGVPLVESMSALIDQMESPELKNALTQTRDRVNEGSSLHAALRPHDTIFPTLYVNMVEAGEASGTLEVVLARLADFLEARRTEEHDARAVLAQGPHAARRRDALHRARVALVEDLAPDRVVDDQDLGDRHAASVAGARALLAPDGPIEDGAHRRVWTLAGVRRALADRLEAPHLRRLLGLPLLVGDRGVGEVYGLAVPRHAAEGLHAGPREERAELAALDAELS